jgi:hypothetical protein
VERTIVTLRGYRVMLDWDLARLYGVPVKRLKEQVRNRSRFPADFMIELTPEEALRSRSQFATLNSDLDEIIELSGSAPRGTQRGKNLKYTPCAFTEQGVAMLSSVLRSPRAVRVNIEIMRAFVRLRRLLRENADLARKLEALEAKYDEQFRVVFDAIRELMTPLDTPKKRIGFERNDD